MATSVNGFAVIQTSRTDGSLPRLRKWIIPGTGGRYLLIRDGSVGFILIHMALWFHEKVESLSVGVWDEWGWAVRPVRGQTTGYSNHSSGTAIDLNATQHPIGVAVSHTYTASQRRRIMRRLRLYRGLITWGGVWSRPDGMHFEIAEGKTLPQVERVARMLANSPRGRRILEANPGARKVIFS